MKKINPKFKEFSKVGIGIFIIFLLVNQLEMEKLVQTFDRADYKYLWAAFLVFGLATLIEALRFHLLIKKDGIRLLITLRVFLISIFFSNFLPGSNGGDGYKIFFLKQKVNSWSQSVAIVGIERLTGLFILVLAGIIYILFHYRRLLDIYDQQGLDIHLNFSPWVILTVIAAVAIGYIFLSRLNEKLKRINAKLYVFTKNCKSALKQITFRNYVLLMILTIFFHLARLIGFFFLVICFQDMIRWDDLIFVLFFVALISLVPITIGGLGLREGAIAVGLSAFGVSNPGSVAVALTNRVVTWLIALVGSVLFILHRKETGESAIHDSV